MADGRHFENRYIAKVDRVEFNFVVSTYRALGFINQSINQSRIFKVAYVRRYCKVHSQRCQHIIFWLCVVDFIRILFVFVCLVYFILVNNVGVLLVFHDPIRRPLWLRNITGYSQRCQHTVGRGSGPPTVQVGSGWVTKLSNLGWSGRVGSGVKKSNKHTIYGQETDYSSTIIHNHKKL